MSQPNPRYLVTGAAGFIGSHLVRRLLAEGHDVAGIDNFATGKRRNLEGLADAGPGRWTFWEGDLADPEAAARACGGRDVILHQAAVPSVPRSIERPLESLRSTVTATVTLFEAARRAGARRVVQAASSSVYGGRAALPAPEDAPARPLSPYAAAKASQELYAHAYARTMGLETVSLRYFNVYGPRQAADSPYSGVIARFITAMLAGRRPVIWGDGLTSRDFTYVGDVVDANLAAARCGGDGLAGEVFNIGSGGRLSLIDLVAAINRALGTRLEPEFGPERAGDARHSQADIRRAGAAFGYRPRVPFGEGLAETVAWYRSAPGEAP